MRPRPQDLSLPECVTGGHLDEIQRRINCGLLNKSNINDALDNEGNTLLHLAALAAQANIVTSLIAQSHEIKVDTKKANKAGKTALEIASMRLSQIISSKTSSPRKKEDNRGEDTVGPEQSLRTIIEEMREITPRKGRSLSTSSRSIPHSPISSPASSPRKKSMEYKQLTKIIDNMNNIADEIIQTFERLYRENKCTVLEMEFTEAAKIAPKSAQNIIDKRKEYNKLGSTFEEEMAKVQSQAEQKHLLDLKMQIDARLTPIEQSVVGSAAEIKQLVDQSKTSEVSRRHEWQTYLAAAFKSGDKKERKAAKSVVAQRNSAADKSLKGKKDPVRMRRSSSTESLQSVSMFNTDEKDKKGKPLARARSVSSLNEKVNNKNKDDIRSITKK